MSDRGDFKKVIRAAKQQGFAVSSTRGGHRKFMAPDGVTTVIAGHDMSERNWHNFISQMRKAGFDMNGATTNLGEAIREAGSKNMKGYPEDNAPPKKYGAISEVVKNVLREKPEHIFTVSDIVTIVKARGAAVTLEQVSNSLARMAAQDTIMRCDRGTYKWKGNLRGYDGDKAETPSPAVAMAVPVTVPAVPESAEISEDELELDEALAALGRIEAVVRKYKIIIKQMREFKKKLLEDMP